MGPPWRAVSSSMGVGLVSRHDVRYAIEAGAFYDARLRRQWRAERPEADRLSLMFASYNAGLGSILNAQRRCNGAPPYQDIIACLPQVTGRHATETTTYVAMIWPWFREMDLLPTPPPHPSRPTTVSSTPSTHPTPYFSTVSPPRRSRPRT